MIARHTFDNVGVQYGLKALNDGANAVVISNYEYLAPVHVGDKVTCQQKVVDIYDKKGGALWFVVSETEMKDQAGKPVAKAKGITVVRNPDAAKK